MAPRALSKKGGLVEIEFPAARAIEYALRDLAEYAGSRTAYAAMTRSLKTVSQPIVMMARSLAPEAGYTIHRYGKSIPSGNLKRQVNVSTTLSRRQRRLQGHGARGEAGTKLAVVYIGTSPRGPGVLMEFGTGPRYTKSGAYRGMVAAHPFMRPAWEAGKYKLLEAFAKELWQQIAAAAERARRKYAKGTKR